MIQLTGFQSSGTFRENRCFCQPLIPSVGDAMEVCIRKACAQSFAHKAFCLPTARLSKKGSHQNQKKKSAASHQHHRVLFWIFRISIISYRSRLMRACQSCCNAVNKIWKWKIESQFSSGEGKSKGLYFGFVFVHCFCLIELASPSFFTNLHYFWPVKSWTIAAQI